MKVNDGPQLGPINDRDVFPEAARVRAALQRQRGWVNPYIPKKERERQRPCDEHLRSNLERQSWNENVNQSQASSFIFNVVAQTTKKRMARSGIVGRVVITVSR